MARSPGCARSGRALLTQALPRGEVGAAAAAGLGRPFSAASSSSSGLPGPLALRRCPGKEARSASPPRSVRGARIRSRRGSRAPDGGGSGGGSRGSAALPDGRKAWRGSGVQEAVWQDRVRAPRGGVAGAPRGEGAVFGVLGLFGLGGWWRRWWRRG